MTWAEKSKYKIYADENTRTGTCIIIQLQLSIWRRKWQPTPVSCLETPRDGGAWWAALYGVAQSQTWLKRLSSSSSSSSNSQASVQWLASLSQKGIEQPKRALCQIHRKWIEWLHEDKWQCDYCPYFLYLPGSFRMLFFLSCSVSTVIWTPAEVIGFWNSI